MFGGTAQQKFAQTSVLGGERQMIGLILSHLASLVLGGVLGFMVSSLCVASSMNERGEEDDRIYLRDV